MGKRKVGKVKNGHPRVTYTKPSGGESDEPMELEKTKRQGKLVNRLNILRSNRKRNK